MKTIGLEFQQMAAHSPKSIIHCPTSNQFTKRGHLPKAKRLLAKGADVNVKHL
jgi:cytosine/adenosine deaminase-related metal-dependent hydrolase